MAAFWYAETIVSQRNNDLKAQLCRKSGNPATPCKTILGENVSNFQSEFATPYICKEQKSIKELGACFCL
jgi:hypothetical protein